jgi:probable F420-dependent oxidoreductase
MKFGIAFANVGPFSQPEPFEGLVRSAEENGIESLWTVEHVVVPVGYESPYPYSPSGRMPGPENSPIPDPILPLVYAAALTERLRLGTGILILPQRHPAYVAKEIATLDVLSRGRALLGVGIGWLEEEFEVVGVPFRERAPRTEEAVRAIRALWAERPEPFEGRFYRWPAVESNPKPVQRPGVPVVVGGHVEGAARRAARVGDGFFPVQSDKLPQLLPALRAECERIGRDPSQIELTTSLPARELDAVRRMQDLGVSRLVMGPPAFDAEGLRRALGDFADRVIAKV